MGRTDVDGMKSRATSRLVLPCVFALLAVSACSGEDASEATSAADLTAHLPPAEELPIAGDLPLESQEKHEWDKALDFVNLGAYLGAETDPAEVAKAIEDEGFVAAAGESLVNEEAEVFPNVFVAAFDSEDGAEAVQDILHEEDLKQPCKKACIVAPVEISFEDVPDSLAAHHKPIEAELPKGKQPIEAFHISFTIDSNLYLLQTSGSPDVLDETNFEEAATAFYEHAEEQN